jgi:hypothetical protein
MVKLLPYSYDRVFPRSSRYGFLPWNLYLQHYTRHEWTYQDKSHLPATELISAELFVPARAERPFYFPIHKLRLPTPGSTDYDSDPPDLHLTPESRSRDLTPDPEPHTSVPPELPRTPPSAPVSRPEDSATESPFSATLGTSPENPFVSTNLTLGPCEHLSTEVGGEDNDEAGDLIEIQTEDK